MRLDLTGRNVDITPALRQLLSRKLSRLERLLSDSALSAQVVLTRERYRHVTDITLHARGDNVLTGVASASAWQESMTEAVEKVTQQAQRVKEKWTTRKRRGTGTRGLPVEAPEPGQPVAEPAPPRLARVRYPIRRLDLATAVARLDKASEPFVVYRDEDTQRLSLVYRRKNGSIGLIEPEA